MERTEQTAADIGAAPAQYLPGIQIEQTELFALQEMAFTSRASKILFITGGQIELKMGGYLLDTVGARNMVFARLGMQCRIRAIKDSRLIFIRLPAGSPLQESLSQAYISGFMDNVAPRDVADKSLKSLPVLPLNTCMRIFVIGLLSCMPYLSQDESFAAIKIREFFYLVAMSYSEKDRQRFFESLDPQQQDFAAFIYRNYKRACSVRELAAMSSYSLSGFEKRFHKVFAQTASSWIATRKAMDIYTQICDTAKPFKVLSLEYGFSCQAHFNRFCRKHLGQAPGMIRTAGTAQKKGASLSQKSNTLEQGF